MEEEKVYIIIVNYNSAEYTNQCLQSLEQNTYKNYDVIVVDNASTDNSYHILKEQFSNHKNITVLHSNINLGFAGGNNYGIRFALDQGGTIFLLLNNDTEVEPNFLSILMQEYYQKSILTPRINYYDDPQTAWYAAGYLDRKRCIARNGNPSVKCTVSFASGCCMLFSKQIINTIGFMDETFFMYYEDADYSLKAIEAGIDIIYIPTSVIYHKVGKSSGGKESKLSIYYNNRNRFYLIKEYEFGFYCRLYTAITRTCRYITARLRKSNDSVIYEAYKDFRHGIKGPKVF